MNISELIQGLETIEKLQLSMPIIIILSILLIGCIKIKDKSLWHRLFVRIGKDLNKEVLEKVDKLKEDINETKQDLKNHIADSEIEKMKNIRQKIIRFSDEVYAKRKHSKEHYEEMMDFIDVYEKFCKLHPDFPNNMALDAIRNIKEQYTKHKENNDFEWG